MQRLALTSNLHFGLALGIATAGVVLALGGCATTGSTSMGRTGPGSSAGSAAPTVALEQFSEDEQIRIRSVQTIVAKAAAEHQVDPALINAMIWVESRFNPKAKSPAGARGLMQLMPATAAYLAKRLGEHSARAYDPEFNVRAGALYLAEMMAKFGDEHHAVAAYHAGPGNVKKWVEAGKAFPDYSDAYVAKVMEARLRFASVEVHGRPSGARATPAATGSRAKVQTRPTASPVAKPTELSADEPDDLVVPDVDTLPDAAEIHGESEGESDRVSEDRFEFEPEPEYEPVFEVHPELDRDQQTPAPGWNTSKPKAQPQPKRTPRPAPKPEPKPEPEAEPPEEAGLGVLPDL